jgi:hypothetical protein
MRAIINAESNTQETKKATNAIKHYFFDDIAGYNNTDFAPILNRTPYGVKWC